MTSVPEDPQEWTDEQWLAWLAEGDAAERAGDGAEPERPSVESWRTGPVGRQLLAASMIGLAEAIYGRKDKPAIVVDASGDPPGDGPMDLFLDPDHPEESVVVIRPWLLDHGHGDEASAAT